jgi:hypothetical protein
VTTIINKTPHPVHLVDNEGKVFRTFPGCPKEDLIRLASETVPQVALDGVPTSRTVFGEPTGLPEAVDDVFYIVSQLVKSALPERIDLLVPAEVVRDSDGQIIGCRCLGR